MGFNPSSNQFNQQLSSFSAQDSQIRSQIPIPMNQQSVQNLEAGQVSQQFPQSFETLRSSQLPVSQSFQNLGSPQPTQTFSSSQLSQPLSYTSDNLRSSQLQSTPQLSQQLSQSVGSFGTQVSQPLPQPNLLNQNFNSAPQQLGSQSFQDLRLQSTPLQTPQILQSIPQSLLTITRSGQQNLQIPQSIPQSLLSISQSIPQNLQLPQSIPQSLLSIPQSVPILSPAQRLSQVPQSQLLTSQQLPNIATLQLGSTPLQNSQLLATNNQLRDTSAFSTPSLNLAQNLPQPLQQQPLAQIRSPAFSQPISSPAIQTSGFVSPLNNRAFGSQYSN